MVHTIHINANTCGGLNKAEEEERKNTHYLDEYQVDIVFTLQLVYRR